MPKVYTANKFKMNRKDYIDDMNKSADKYMFIANETVAERSFVIVQPAYMSELFSKSGNRSASKFIKDTMGIVKEKISKRYREIRSKG